MHVLHVVHLFRRQHEDCKDRPEHSTSGNSASASKAAGCPMPFREKNERPVDLTIEVNRPELTRSYAIRAGAEYVLSGYTNHAYRPLVLQRFAGRMDWPAALIFPVDPRDHMPETQVYRLKSGPQISLY